MCMWLRWKKDADLFVCEHYREALVSCLVPLVNDLFELLIYFYVTCFDLIKLDHSQYNEQSGLHCKRLMCFHLTDTTFLFSICCPNTSATIFLK